MKIPEIAEVSLFVICRNSRCHSSTTTLMRERERESEVRERMNATVIKKEREKVHLGNERVREKCLRFMRIKNQGVAGWLCSLEKERERERDWVSVSVSEWKWERENISQEFLYFECLSKHSQRASSYSLSLSLSRSLTHTLTRWRVRVRVLLGTSCRGISISTDLTLTR